MENVCIKNVSCCLESELHAMTIIGYIVGHLWSAGIFYAYSYSVLTRKMLLLTSCQWGEKRKRLHRGTTCPVNIVQTSVGVILCSISFCTQSCVCWGSLSLDSGFFCGPSERCRLWWSHKLLTVACFLFGLFIVIY